MNMNQIFLLLFRSKKTGQIYIFNSSARANWISMISDLVSEYTHSHFLTVPKRLGQMSPNLSK